MRITKYILLPIIAAITMSVSATTYVFVPANNSVSTKLCVAAGNDNVHRYKWIAQSNRLRQRFVANKVNCNDQNIGNFAARYNAMKTAAYINKYRKHRVTITDLASAQQDKSDDVVIITVN